jgi:hypothetical protein
VDLIYNPWCHPCVLPTAKADDTNDVSARAVIGTTLKIRCATGLPPNYPTVPIIPVNILHSVYSIRSGTPVKRAKSIGDTTSSARVCSNCAVSLWDVDLRTYLSRFLNL